VPLAGRVDVFPQSASTARHRAVLRIDCDVPHQTEIYNETAVAHAVPGHAVPAAAHRDRQASLACVHHRRGDVVDVERPGDELWPPVEHAVEGAARRLIAAVI
jgi:hypothetical protein